MTTVAWIRSCKCTIKKMSNLNNVLQFTAVEKKNLLKQAETLHKLSHCKLILYLNGSCITIVTLEETLKLLYRYRALTTEKIDRVRFCDLLHDWLGMTDDYFMDKGIINWVGGASTILNALQCSKLSIKIQMVSSVKRNGLKVCRCS